MKSTMMASGPAFLSKFSHMVEALDFIRTLKAQGYTHYLDLTPKFETVGGDYYGFAVLFATAFFKGLPPSFEDLCAGRIAVSIPICERRKYYSQMSSIKRGDFKAWLTGAEIKEWIAFFRADAGTVGEIGDLLN